MIALRVFRCILTTQDFLYFSSYDVKSVSFTELIIHNYALSYAIHYCNTVLDRTKKPQYEQDLKRMTKFPTPAEIVGDATLVEHTYNALDDSSQKTKKTKYEKTFSPSFGIYYKIPPNAKFSFYLVCIDDEPPRRIIRLGKKDCLCTIECRELQDVTLKETDSKSVQISHPINPIELLADIESYERILFIPPSPIALNTRIIGKYLQAKDSKGNIHRIAVTKRFHSAINS